MNADEAAGLLIDLAYGLALVSTDAVEEADKLLVQVLTLRPDDSLIFKVDQLVTDEQAAEIRKRITPNLPDGMRFLIVGRGVEVSVLRQEAGS